MKKQMLILMAIGCLVPMGIDAICFRYVDGPKDIGYLLVEVDTTKVGSYLPTEGFFTTIVGRKSKEYITTRDPDLLKSDTVYVTVKDGTKDRSMGPIGPRPILIKAKKLDNNGAYDITIDDNRNVTFTKTNAACPKRKVIF